MLLFTASHCLKLYVEHEIMIIQRYIVRFVALNRHIIIFSSFIGTKIYSFVFRVTHCVWSSIGHGHGHALCRRSFRETSSKFWGRAQINGRSSSENEAYRRFETKFARQKHSLPPFRKDELTLLQLHRRTESTRRQAIQTTLDRDSLKWHSKFTQRTNPAWILYLSADFTSTVHGHIGHLHRRILIFHAESHYKPSHINTR